MRKTITLFVAAGLAAALLAIPTAASARAEVAEYTGIETAVGMPTDQVTREHGDVFHYSHVMTYFDDTTDRRTTGATMVKMHFVTRDWLNGLIWGTYRTVVANDHGNGVWQGRWFGRMVDGIPVFRAWGHGSGDLKGLRMSASYEGSDAGVITIDGRIIESSRP